MARKGMGKGTGKGYKNMIGVDSKVHSMSAKGVKQPQKINAIVNKTLTNQFKIINDNNVKLQNWRNDIITKYSNKGNDVMEVINFIDEELLLDYKQYSPEYRRSVLDSKIPKVDSDLLKSLETKMSVRFPPLTKETELDKTIKEKFSGYDNQRLVDKANRDFKANKNTDDVDFEIARRKDLGLIKTKVGFDTIELIE